MRKETMRETRRFVRQVRRYPLDPPYLRTEMRQFSEKIGREDYDTRLEEFDSVCERFHDVLQQEEDSGIPAVDALKQRLQGKNVPSFSEFTVEVGQRVERKDASIMRLIQRIGERSELIERENQARNFSKLFVFTYSRLFHQIIFPEVNDVRFYNLREVHEALDVIVNGIQELIRSEYPNTQIAKDLNLQSKLILPDEVSEINQVVGEHGLLKLDVPEINTLIDAMTYISVNGVEIDIDTRKILFDIIRSEPVVGRHALRLLASPFNEDRTFAHVILEYYISSMQMLAEREKISVVTNESSEDAKAFWTFAPRLYFAMTESFSFESASDTQLLQRILLWAKDGNVGDSGMVHLQGLEFLSRSVTNGRMFGLSSDPNSVSHQLVRQVAQRIAEKVLVKDEFDPGKAFL